MCRKHPAEFPSKHALESCKEEGGTLQANTILVGEFPPRSGVYSAVLELTTGFELENVQCNLATLCDDRFWIPHKLLK